MERGRPQETDEQRRVREELEARLAPGESLLAWTVGLHSPDVLVTRGYRIGLTDQRILLEPEDAPEVELAFYPPVIRQARYVQHSPAWRELVLDAGDEQLAFTIPPGWAWLARHLADSYARVAENPPPLAVGPFVRQMISLHGLGLWDAAQKQLRAAMAESPLVEIDPLAESLDRTITVSRNALRAGLMFFAGLLGLLGWLVLEGRPGLWFGAAVAAAASLGLLTGRQSWRGGALLLTLLILLINGFISLLANRPLEIGLWAAFACAVALVFTGSPSRMRTASAVVVFLVGAAGAVLLY